jgi:putative nucleotidyltransferase with HDIG domain
MGMEKIDLKTITEHIESLPTLPEVIIRLMATVNDPDSSADDVKEILVHDPALAAQILKIVNSASFGMYERIGDLNQAIVLLGFNRLRDIAFTTSVIKALNIGSGAQFDFRRLWVHSIVVAQLAAQIAKTLKTARPEMAYVVGLLHDVGKILMYRYDPKMFMEFVRLANNEHTSFGEVERRMLDTDHAEVGSWLAEQWNFPVELIHGIRYHENPEKLKAYIYAGLCNVAMYMGTVKFFAPPGDFNPVPVDAAIWDRIGMEKQVFFSVLSAVEREKDLAEAMVGAGV